MILFIYHHNKLSVKKNKKNICTKLHLLWDDWVVLIGAYLTHKMKKFIQRKIDNGTFHFFKILQSIVGLWLGCWVITLSLPSANSIGRCNASLGCQLLPKALLTQSCSLCLFFSWSCFYFSQYRHVCRKMSAKTQLHFWFM